MRGQRPEGDTPIPARQVVPRGGRPQRSPSHPRHAAIHATAAAGLTCDDAPVLSDPLAACLAFHPSAAAVTDSVNGWREGFYCNFDAGLACTGFVGCATCPACSEGFSCGTSGSDELSELYVECVP